MENNFYMTRSDIMKCLETLNENMKLNNIFGEICLVGGAVMCLCYKSREVTRDIDAVFEPKSVMNKIIEDTAAERFLIKTKYLLMEVLENVWN